MSEAAPVHGVRFTLELGHADEGGARYRGRALGPGLAVELEARVTRSGDDVSVEVVGEATEGTSSEAATIAKLAGPIVKTAVRSAVVRGQPPPRRIQRWRER